MIVNSIVVSKTAAQVKPDGEKKELTHASDIAARVNTGPLWTWTRLLLPTSFWTSIEQWQAAQLRDTQDTKTARTIGEIEWITTTIFVSCNTHVLGKCNIFYYFLEYMHRRLSVITTSCWWLNTSLNYNRLSKFVGSCAQYISLNFLCLHFYFVCKIASALISFLVTTRIA